MVAISSLNISSVNQVPVLDATASTSAGWINIARAVATLSGPLAPAVKELSGALDNTLGGQAGRVTSGQLESAMLDFAREARALAIGNPDCSRADLDTFLTNAIDAGVAKAAALPDVGLSQLDKAVALFSEASGSLSSRVTAPLFDPGNR